MKTEYEARFCDIDHKTIIEQLEWLGAVQRMPRTLMRRIVFKNSDITVKGGWLRLRDQGNKITLTYKQENTDAGTGIERILESEVEVSGFQETKQLLEAMGFTAERCQENYREEWELDGVVFDLDMWPGLPPFLEIEGPDEPAVQAAAAKLGLDFAQAGFGSVDEVYLAHLGRDILTESTLLFE